jgi:fumarate reductase flavoprotein subunit
MKLKDCSRRDFLKGAVGATVGVAALGMLGACGTTPASTPVPTAAPTPEPTEAVPQEVAFTPDEIVDCDVVVVGVGVAGISACIEAAEMGVSVVGIDRAMSVAATNAVSVVGIYGVGDPAEAGDHFNYLTSSTHYQFNNSFVRYYLDIIDGQIERYKEKGMSIKTVSSPSSAGDFHSVQHMFSSRSTDRAAEFEAMLAGYSNLTLRWQTEVTEILTDGGKVTGVYAKGSVGKVTQYNAKGGVIICTGGFGANLDMIAEYMGGAVALRTGSTFNDGAGIKLARSVGAQIGKNFAINATEGGALNA